jgi:L-rhamnose isomerase/sugar isomerase
MIDQSHCIKDPLEELVESLTNIETACAKALLVDYQSLKESQDACDPSSADRILNDAFQTDVRPLLVEARLAQGLPADPLAAAMEYYLYDS